MTIPRLWTQRAHDAGAIGMTESDPDPMGIGANIKAMVDKRVAQ
jgi:hypothetical protein